MAHKWEMGHSSIQAEGGALARHVSNNKWDHGFLKLGKTDLPTRKEKSCPSKRAKKKWTMVHMHKKKKREGKEMRAHIDTKKIGMFYL